MSEFQIIYGVGPQEAQRAKWRRKQRRRALSFRPAVYDRLSKAAARLGTTRTALAEAFILRALDRSEEP